MAKEMRFDTHSLNSKAYIANDHTNDSFFFYAQGMGYLC